MGNVSMALEPMGSIAAMCGPYGCAGRPSMRSVVLPPSVSNLQLHHASVAASRMGAILPASANTNQIIASGATMGGVIGTWWSDVDALKTRLDPAFQATDADVTKCAAVLAGGAAEVAAWKAFMASWNTYRQDPGGLLFGSAEAYDTGLAYEKQLSAWRVQLRADGCTQSAPDIPAPSSAESEIPSAVKWAAAAVIAASAAYAVLSLRKVV